MNCKTLHDLLHEYMDETLDAKLHADAREHLESCNVCNQAFVREQVFADSIERSLKHAAADLCMPPDMRENILLALKSKQAPSNPWLHAWRDLISVAMQPTGAFAALFVILILILGVRSHRPSVTYVAFKTLADTSQHDYVLNVPIKMETHVFQLRDNTVIDSIVINTSVASASLLGETNEFPLKAKTKPL